MNKKERVNTFGVGQSHSKNKHGGIPIGGPNRVEQGESSVDFKEGKYIFSDRLFIEDDAELPMKFPKGITYAEATSIVKDKFNTGNKIDKDTELEVLEALRTSQEISRANLEAKQGTKFAMGGQVDINEQRDMIEAQQGISDKAQKYQNAATGLQTAGLAAQAIPGVGTFIGAGLAAAGAITGAIGKNKAKKQSDKLAKESLMAKEQEARVFAQGGPVLDVNSFNPSQIQPDLLGVGSIGNAFTIGDKVSPIITSPDSLPTIDFNLEPINDTSSFNFTMPTEKSGLGQPNSQKIGLGEVPAQTSPVGVSNAPVISGGEKSGIINGLVENLGKEGAIGLGAQFATGLAQNIIGLASTKKAPPTDQFPVGSPRQSNDISLEEVRKAIRRQTQSSIQSLAGKSPGDFGQYASNVAAVNASASGALSDATVKEQQINNQEDQFTDSYNLRQSNLTQRNAQIAADLDAQNLGAYNNQRAAYRDSLFANMGSIGKSVQNIGMGNLTLEELMKLAQTQGLNKDTNE